MRGVHIAVDIMAKDILATAAITARRRHVSPPGTPCKEAAKLEFPTDRKARRAYRHECKQAWKAQKKAA